MDFKIKIIISTFIISCIAMIGCATDPEKDNPYTHCWDELPPLEEDNNPIVIPDTESIIPPFSVYDDSIPGGRIDGEVDGDKLILTETRFKSTLEAGTVENSTDKTITINDKDLESLKEAIEKKNAVRDAEQYLYYDLAQSMDKDTLVLTMYKSRFGDDVHIESPTEEEISSMKNIELDTIDRLLESDVYKETDIDGRRQMVLYTLKELYDRGIIKDYMEDQDDTGFISYKDAYGYTSYIKLDLTEWDPMYN